MPQSPLSAWNTDRDESAEGSRRKAFKIVAAATVLIIGVLGTAQLAGAVTSGDKEHHHSKKDQDKKDQDKKDQDKKDQDKKGDQDSKGSKKGKHHSSDIPAGAAVGASLDATAGASIGDGTVVASGRAAVNCEGFAAISGEGDGPTTGGAGGSTVTVTSLSQLETEAARSGAETIKVDGLFSGSGEVSVASDKTIVGVGAHSGLTGIGLKMKGVHNVIIQNMNISKVTSASGDGDAIHVEKSDHIWIDHNDLSSDRDHGKDYYDGLVDITHAGDYVTVSWNKFHDHWKVSLVGHSDSNGAEDIGHLHVTYSHNWFYNVNSRLPSLRFGTGHVYDNYFQGADTAIDSRMGAQILVENNVFRNVKTPIMTSGYSKVDGHVNLSGNDLGGVTNNVTQDGTSAKEPYSYHLDPTSSVISIVTAGAGTGIVG